MTEIGDLAPIRPFPIHFSDHHEQKHVPEKRTSHEEGKQNNAG